MKNSGSDSSPPPQTLSYQSKVKERDEQLVTDQICPKCNGAMERGFILDHHDGEALQSSWIEGSPQRVRFWTYRGVKTQNKRKFHIDTLRCEQCGYLESYATNEA